jgi:RND family efflux transporter MFP subunit
LENAATTDPRVLLDGIEHLAREVATFVDELSEATNATGSGASTEQIASVAAARASVSSVLTSVTGAQTTLRSGQTSSTASVDASVKSALGTLRLAEASLERTRIRAPIGGTVNYLPIRVGDYVATLDHVATVAQNGALEIVAFVSEDALASVSAGQEAMIEGRYPGTITSVSPALDPITKQIELHIAVTGAAGLVNGQSVRIILPGATSVEGIEGTPTLLPLSAVKLSAGTRVVFTLGEDGRLRALPVEIGEVVGEKIEVRSPLPGDLRIVSDARGLSDGQQVRVAEE